VDLEIVGILIFGVGVLVVVWSKFDRRLGTVGEVIRGLLLAAAVLVAVGWYFLVYDTAEGKCNRGDLGACVVAGQHRIQQGQP
jgi:4-amino-4-deoxy-L-arabinose transferase-like glycosyltransferase